MGKGRLEAFSDGVIAIIITIMVLELKVPHGADLAALPPLLPVFLSYVLSFVYVGIYWNNHHHMLHAADAGERARCCGRTCTCCSGCRCSRSPPAGWARTTSPRCPRRCTASVLLMAAIAYWLLQQAIIAAAGAGLGAAHARSGATGRASCRRCSTCCAIAATFWPPWLAQALYVAVALLWLVPDRRIEQVLAQGER